MDVEKPKRRWKEAYNPSREEIRLKCWEIQATWSPRVERLRAGCFAERRPVLPVMDERELMGDMAG